MNCGDISQRFWEINNKERLGANATMLYFFLIKIYNESSQNLFTYADIQICEEIGITRPTIKIVREKLKKVGLIDYDTKRFHPCEYKIILPGSGNENTTEFKITEEYNTKSGDIAITNSSELIIDEGINTEDIHSDNIISEEKHDIFYKTINKKEEPLELDDEYYSRLEPTSLPKLLDKINPTVVQEKKDIVVTKNYTELTFEEDVERNLKQLQEYKATLEEKQNVTNDNYQIEKEDKQDFPYKIDVEEKEGHYHTENEKADQPDISSEIVDNRSSEVNETKEKTEIEKKESLTPLLDEDKDGNIPSKEEFLSFAKSVEIYDKKMDFEIATKYETWLKDGWKDGYKREITDWKSAIKRSMPYFRGTPGRSAKVEPIYRPKNLFSSR